MAIYLNPYLFPMWDSTDKQSHMSHFCENETEQFELNVIAENLPAFQMRRDGLSSGAITISFIRLVEDDGKYCDVTSTLSGLISADTENSVTYLHYDGATISWPETVDVKYSGGTTYASGANFANRYYCGQRVYLHVRGTATSPSETYNWYSERFYFIRSSAFTNPADTLNRYLRLRNFYISDTGEIYTSADDIQITESYLLVKADLCKPSYPVNKESQEDGRGAKTEMFARVSKRYRLEFRAPEWLTDAMAVLQASGSVNNAEVYDPWLDNVYTTTEVEYEVNWNNGCYADIALEFNVDYARASYC